MAFCLFTDPEFARIGLSEKQVEEQLFGLMEPNDLRIVPRDIRVQVVLASLPGSGPVASLSFRIRIHSDDELFRGRRGLTLMVACSAIAGLCGPWAATFAGASIT
jgi:hypothetical protein